MLSHYPTYREGAEAGLVHKRGGLSWGYPLGRWPLCKECGRDVANFCPDSTAYIFADRGS